MCAGGPEQMLADAALAVAQEPQWSPWRHVAVSLLAEAHLLAGHPGEALDLLMEASTAAATWSNPDDIVYYASHLAPLAMDRGDWEEAASRLRHALATIDQNRMHDCWCLLAFAGAARLALHQGDLPGAHRQLTAAMRGRPSVTYALPFVAVRLRLQLAKIYLALADAATAHQLLREIDDILSHRPALGTLTDQVDKFRRVLASGAATATTGRSPLTPAELRLLPYLQTHLTASGIADRLVLSTHTVKAQLKSIYRKLDVTTRNDAVRKATTIGLLGA
jgi:LuxR family maltose regulon positive regulatory protein